MAVLLSSINFALLPTTWKHSRWDIQFVCFQMQSLNSHFFHTNFLEYGHGLQNPCKFQMKTNLTKMHREKSEWEWDAHVETTHVWMRATFVQYCIACKKIRKCERGRKSNGTALKFNFISLWIYFYDFCLCVCFLTTKKHKENTHTHTRPFKRSQSIAYGSLFLFRSRWLVIAVSCSFNFFAYWMK